MKTTSKKSSYSEWNIKNVQEHLKKAIEARAKFIDQERSNGRPSFVEFTTNTKLNGIVTFGTLAGVDCGAACKECLCGCYAIRHLQGRSAEKLAKCARNSARLANDRGAFFSDITNRARLAVVFRWHESGEVIDADYFARIVKACKDTPNCQHLLFTKRFDIVNNWMDENGALPENLCLMLSAWGSVATIANVNRHGLPLAAPDFSEAPEKYRKPFDANGLNVRKCNNDCAACYLNKCGCFGAKFGDVVAFKAH